MKFRHLLLPCAGFLLAAVTASAQPAYLKDVNGQVILSNKYTNVEGSPYLNEVWAPGSITSPNNKVYSNMKVRYDAHAEELEYEDKGKSFRLTAANIKGFSFFDGTDTLRFRQGFQPVGGNTAGTFYQVLYDGTIKLLKHVKVAMAEIQVYNSATKTKQFSRGDQYYAVKPDGSLHKIQRTRKSLASVFPEQKALIDKAAKENELDQDAGLTAIFAALDAKK